MQAFVYFVTPFVTRCRSDILSLLETLSKYVGFPGLEIQNHLSCEITKLALFFLGHVYRERERSKRKTS